MTKKKRVSDKAKEELLARAEEVLTYFDIKSGADSTDDFRTTVIMKAKSAQAKVKSESFSCRDKSKRNKGKVDKLTLMRSIKAAAISY
jgi:hypothetical protein